MTVQERIETFSALNGKLLLPLIADFSSFDRGGSNGYTPSSIRWPRLMMYPRILMSLLLMLPFFSHAEIPTHADSTQSLEHLLNQCESCHTQEHNHQAEVQAIAPVLNGLDDDYIEQQIINFQTGKRTASGDQANIINRAHSTTVIEGEALSLIADHYEELELRISQIALSETASQSNQGEILFEDQCASCHTSAFGRFLSDSPQITHLEAPYLLQQLKKMKHGQRGFHEENKHHRKMVERLKGMSTQDLVDIVTYIHQNAESL